MKRKRDGEENEGNEATTSRRCPVLTAENKTLYIDDVQVNDEGGGKILIHNRNRRIIGVTFRDSCFSHEMVSMLWLIDESHDRARSLRCNVHGYPLCNATVLTSDITFMTRCTRRCFSRPNLAIAVIECHRDHYQWGVKSIVFPRDPEVHEGMNARLDRLNATLNDVLLESARKNQELQAQMEEVQKDVLAIGTCTDHLCVMKEEMIDAHHDVVSLGSNVEQSHRILLRRHDALRDDLQKQSERFDSLECTISLLSTNHIALLKQQQTLIEQQMRIMVFLDSLGK
jgi:hypothetical protein